MTCCKKKLPFHTEPRRVKIGNSKENKRLYISNFISTTHYSALSFFPLSLLKQFQQYANIYFLIQAILQSIPVISPLNPVSSIFPLVVVLGLSMAREGLEDLARRKSDIKLNSSVA